MRTSIPQTLIATTAILGLSAFAAVAAPPAGGDPTAIRPNATTSAAWAKLTQAGASHSMAGKIEQRISDLHAKLLISPAQQPQWDRFSQVMRDNAQSMDQTFQHRVQTLPGMTAAENMQSFAQVSMDHAKEMQKLVAAFQTLYDTMSDSQKRTTDQVFRNDANHGDQARRS